MRYPTTVATRSNFMDISIPLIYNTTYNNCSNTLCYTASKNYIYKPHTAKGMVGTTAYSSRARRTKV